MKPILFNTEMVRAFLDGRKTQTRRLVKPQPIGFTGRNFIFADDECPKKWEQCDDFISTALYHTGDILWVRETWSKLKYPDGSGRYVYKASDEYPFGEDGYIVKFRWRPSIHMPKEAARLFLRVTDVRVERLWDIQPTDICAEGVCVGANDSADAAYKSFTELWDNTIKHAGRDRYGWDANPWVWVYTFKRCGKEGESWNG